MIIDINRDSLGMIVNDDFRADAERYVRIYDDFMSAVKDSGIGIDGLHSSTGFTYKNLAENVSGVECSGFGHSLRYGEVSPACADCRTGLTSMTVFHTLKCNRDCFFCANMNQGDYDFYLENENDAFAEVLAADGGFGLTSIALTGGEPLLLPEKAIDFFEKCRAKYPEAHLRLYTNGDFLTPMLATKLANAGLDEVRVSVKAEGEHYPKETVEIIRSVSGIIPCVMVEMPVIPGTLETMKKLFVELDEAGADAINILEFLYPWVNSEKYANRGFKVKPRPYRVLYDYGYAGGLPVAGSGEECVELLKFAAEKELNMRVHFCSLENKLTSQIYIQNSSVSLTQHEVMSERDFFIKSARAYGSNALKAQKYLASKGIEHVTSGIKTEFHPRYISEIKGLTEVAVTYNVAEFEENCKVIREVKIDLVKPEHFDYDTDI
jgi:pyruvate formate-lyase activating enzyme-like uncharacterized protein